MEKLPYQCLKKCVNATHGSRRELVSQIAVVEPPLIALDTAQARVMAKMMGYQTALEGIWGVPEEGRQWDDFDEPYPNRDGFTSVFTRIQSRAGILMEEGNERLQCGGRVVPVQVVEVTLQAKADSTKEIWQLSINEGREDATVVFTNGSKAENGRV